jgi:hypothetical protein
MTMVDPEKSLWQIFVAECRQCLLDYVMPLIVLARWIRRHSRK